MAEKPTRTGYVYVLSHPVWSHIRGTGAVKIGQTGSNPATRGRQIASTSGLLVPPTVEFCCWVADRVAVESAVHRHFHCQRIHRRREMFAVSVDQARDVIEAATEVRAIGKPSNYGARPSRRLSRRLQQRLVGLAILLVSGTLLVLCHAP